MEKTHNIVKRIGEVERKISDGESLFRKASNAGKLGWVFLVLGIILLVFLGWVFKIIGILVIGASAWRLYSAEKFKTEIEEGLREYRGEKAELNALLATKKKI
ncbi:hypothetical protein MNBD_CHLOROFLEXI01-1033 [hydrothermal vent metagenome]|uniref:Uncharacterized protein n=1 Tax=hydrothermal vent metagenome TaxID=652676 RepID=A0A3B0V6T9_9ZZZZ